MNRIKSKGRAGLKNSVLNSLMCISSDGDSLESFDPQPAVNEWTNNVCRRPGSRKDRPTSSSTLRLSDCESFTDDNSEYDSELIHSEISDHDEYDN